MKVLSYLIPVVAMSFILVNCGGGDDDDDGGGGGDDSLSGVFVSQIRFSAPDLGLTALLEEDCTVSLDNYRTDAVCITPSGVAGYARLIEGVDSGSADVVGSGTARIAGTTENIEGGEGQILNGSEFDFSSSAEINSYNELWSAYEAKPTYDHLSININYQRVAFQANDSYITMLLVTHSQPFADSDDLDGCGFSASELGQSRFSDVDDTVDGGTFQRGDYLFCVKSSDEACAIGDFQWYDLDENELTSTRPSTPRTNTWITNESVDCSVEGDRSTVTIPGFPMVASLTTEFQLYADFSHGVNSTQYPEERGALGEEPDPDHLEDEDFEQPYLIYYYEDEDGNEATGSDMEMDVSFDVTNLVMVVKANGGDSLDDMSLNYILENVYTKHGWLFHNKGEDDVVGWDVDDAAAMSATVDVTLSGGTGRPSVTEVED